MGLVEHNKRLLDLTTSALGGIYEVQYLWNAGLIKNLTAEEGLLNKRVLLGDDFVEILLVGRSAFPTLSWLVKGIGGNKNNYKERKFN